METPVKKDYPIDSIDWSCRDREERLYPEREWGEGNWMMTPVKTIEQPFLQAMIDMGATLTDWMGEWTMFADKCYIMFHVYDGFINLECISTMVEERRKGVGSKVMQAIVAAAKETNTEIRLRACNVTGGRNNIFVRVPHIVISEGTKTKNKIPTAKLAKWYKKFGFVKVADVKHRGKNAGVNMVYNQQK
jgi:GNAT superfamily N-acetyltransferase